MFCTQKIIFSGKCLYVSTPLAPSCPEAEPQLGLRPNSWGTGIISWGRELSKDLEKIYFALSWDSETPLKRLCYQGDRLCFCYAVFTGVNTPFCSYNWSKPRKIPCEQIKLWDGDGLPSGYVVGFRVVVVVVLSSPKTHNKMHLNSPDVPANAVSLLPHSPWMRVCF